MPFDLPKNFSNFSSTLCTNIPSAIEAGIVNKIYTFVAPKIIGGKNAKSPISGEGFADLETCIKVKNQKIKKIDCDYLIVSEVI